MLIEVKITTFRDNGKWYESWTFKTYTNAFDSEKIAEECKAHKRTKGKDFTFEAENPNGRINFRLVKQNNHVK